MKRPAVLCAFALVAALAISACGSSSKSSSSSSSTTTKSQTTSTKAANPNAKEKPPPGDIPDATQFVQFAVPGSGYSIRVPEGWARTGSGSKLTFTSNLNTVTVDSAAAKGTVTPATVKSTIVPALQKTVKGLKLQSIDSVKRGGQTAIRVRYLAQSGSNAVTGQSVTTENELYIYPHNAREAIVTLAGAKGADNVDAWKTISNSLKWSK
jgi:ABC-type oligopeptide transport system substrate-binding subunit